jgi:hypothetical protein
MSSVQPTYSLGSRLIVVIALLLACGPAESQYSTGSITVLKREVPPRQLSFHKPVFVSPAGKYINSRLLLVPSNAENLGSYPHYLDSLKIKASRNLLTRTIFDAMVVRKPQPVKIVNSGESEAAFSQSEGMKIRNITVRRLDVFGSSIKEPDAENPDKVEKLLNKTHINTLEAIIRKNLLFKSGDVASPLVLSDNERLLRQLSYIDDARIIAVPVSENETDIVVLTKDIYSLAASYNYGGLKKGNLSVFEKNIFGMGHEFGIEIPFDTRIKESPGFGAHYKINNIARSFTNIEGFYLDDLREKSYGFIASKELISASTKYAGGISIIQMKTSEDLGSLEEPQLLRYNFQDYWLSRSFLLDRNTVSRIIIGARYTHNNIFNRPAISPDSYHELQNYRLYLASAAFSVQKYFKASLIYGYGRTEDIPYGGIVKFTAGNEINEFKHRYYFGTELALGKAFSRIGYVYSSIGISSFMNEGNTEQGMIAARINHFSNLFAMGRNMMRLFTNFRYTKGFNRYTDEHLLYPTDNGFSGFRNDSVTGIDRFSLGLETVVFSPANVYGFRFAFFAFADYSFLEGEYNQPLFRNSLSSVGIGVRIRNDNLLFNTLQIRLAYYPNPPDYSRISNVIISGEQLLRPSTFDPGPPSIIYYR